MHLFFNSTIASRIDTVINYKILTKYSIVVHVLWVYTTCEHKSFVLSKVYSGVEIHSLGVIFGITWFWSENLRSDTSVAGDIFFFGGGGCSHIHRFSQCCFLGIALIVWMYENVTSILRHEYIYIYVSEALARAFKWHIRDFFSSVGYIWGLAPPPPPPHTWLATLLRSEIVESTQNECFKPLLWSRLY